MGRACKLRWFLCNALLMGCPLTLLSVYFLHTQRIDSGFIGGLDDQRNKSTHWFNMTMSVTSSLHLTDRPLSDAALLARIRNGSVRCSDIQAMFPGRVPPVVHWTNKDNRVIRRHQKMLQSWLKVLGNSVVYMYWEDKDAEQLVSKHYPQLWQHYKSFPNGLLRSDIARLAIVHHTGGVYSDLDVELLRNLHPLLHNYTALWSQDPLEHIYYIYQRDRLLSNAIFLSKARHPFLSFVINSWPGWFSQNWGYRRRILVVDSSKAVDATGPMMVNHFLDRYPNTTSQAVFLAHPDLFQPTWDFIYAPEKAKQRCKRPDALPAHRRQLCDLLRQRQFKVRPVPKEAFAVHKFFHTGYASNQNYKDAKSAREILPLSRCIV